MITDTVLTKQPDNRAMFEETLSKEDIENRLEDWKSRISNLYSSIEHWLDSHPSYSVRILTEVPMYEEIMQQYHVSPTTLKVLDVYHKNQIVATIKPIGLWLIGANGRVDILCKNGAVTLVDKSEKFHTPVWVAYSGTKSYEGKPFNSDFLFDLLGVPKNEHI
ncbi:MAG: hypothetical protein WCI11_00790 [Candidatus Methylumidiphilus sp.]